MARPRPPGWNTGVPGVLGFTIVTLVLLGASAQPRQMAATPELAGEGVVISGTVLTTSGLPLAGATVGLAPVMDNYGFYVYRLGTGGGMWAERVAEVTTGADGRYALAAAPGRRWRVIVEHPDHATSTRRLNPLEEDRELEAVRLEPGRELEILVRGPGGAPVAGARIIGHSVETAAEQPWPSSWSAASTDGAGRARVQVEDSAPWRVEVVADGLAPVDWEHDGDGVAEIRLERASRLDLDLRLASGEPAAGAVVFRPGKGICLAGADARGRAALYGEPGTALTVAALTAAGDAVETEVELPDAGTPARRTLELAPPTRLAIEVVSARGGDPVAGAVAWGSDDRVFHGDAGGRLHLVVPATEDTPSVSVVAPGHLPHREEELPLEVLGGYALTVALEPAARLDGRVVNAAGRTVTGTVAGPDGRPVAGATVEAFRQRSGAAGPPPAPAEASAITGPGGVFALRDLGPGRVDLRITAEGFAAARVPGVEIGAVGDGGGAAPVEVGRLRLEPGHLIAGRVVDADGRPLPGVAVELHRLEQAPTGVHRRPEKAVSGEDGGFAFTDRPAGAYELRAEEDGLLATSSDRLQTPLPSPVELMMLPGATLAGRVVDTAGAAVAGARVGAFPTRGGHPRVRVTTDRDGRFELAGLGPVRYSVDVEAEGFQPHERFWVLLSEAGGDPLELVLERGATVVGRVLRSDDRPVDGAQVEVRPAVGGEGRDAIGLSDANGLFEISGAPLGAVVMEARRGSLTSTLHVELEPGRNPVTLVLPEGVAVSGRVVDADGRPVAAARVILGLGSAAVEARSDGQGAFTLTDATPGRHRLTVRHPDFVEHVSGAGVVVADRPLSGLEVRLRRGARVSGTVPGLTPDELASTRVVLERVGLHGTFDVAPDHRGRFVAENLPPGEYEVEAVLDGVVATAAFELAEGIEALDVELRPTSGIDLHGRVVQGGSGVGQVKVRALTGDGRAVSAETTADGRFVLPKLPRGPLDLTARDMAGNPHRRRVELRAGEPVVLELPSASVSGRVTDGETGEPVHRPTVYLETLVPPPDTRVAAGWQGRIHRRAMGDSRGAYLFPAVESGRYRVRAEDRGRGMAMRRVEVGRQPVGGVDFTLARPRGLWLRVSGEGGVVEKSVTYALFDPAGLLEVVDSVDLDPGGRVHLGALPAGSWQLWVRSGESAWEERRVETPAEEVSVRLIEGAEMTASLPPVGGELERLTFTLRDAGGRAPVVVQPAISHGPVPWELEQMEAFEPELYARNLWPGEWTLEAIHPDGRTWQATFTARPGETIDVELR